MSNRTHCESREIISRLFRNNLISSYAIFFVIGPCELRYLANFFFPLIVRGGGGGGEFLPGTKFTSA